MRMGIKYVRPRGNGNVDTINPKCVLMRSMVGLSEVYIMSHDVERTLWSRIARDMGLEMPVWSVILFMKAKVNGDVGLTCMLRQVAGESTIR